jgi:hypothetical protein
MPEALPELGALAAVAALLIIAGALWVLQGLIRNSLGRLPVVGSWITNNIDSALNDARNLVLDGAGATWGVAQTLFRWMIDFFRNPVAQILFFMAETYSFAVRVRDVWIPDLESRVLTVTSGWVSSAESYAGRLYDTAVADVNAEVSSALVTASGWVTAAERDAVNLFDTATADIARTLTVAETDAANALARASTALESDIHAAEAFAAGEIGSLAASVQAAVNTLDGDITRGIATAESVAAANLGAAVGGIYTDLDTWGREAVADVWPGAAGDIDALRNVLGADFPWLRDLTGALAGAGAAGLLGALIRSMATSQALTRLATDCVVPQCRNLGGLSNDLGNLLSTASTAAMLAWLIFGVTDPAGWAQETGAVGGPIASGLADAAAKLFQER